MTFGLTVLKSNWSPPPHGVCVRFQVCVTTPLTHTHTLWCLYIGSVAVLPAAIWVTHHAWVDTKRHTLEDIQTYRTHIHTHSGESSGWVISWWCHCGINKCVCVSVHHYLEARSALKAFVFLPLFNNVPQTSNLILEVLSNNRSCSRGCEPLQSPDLIMQSPRKHPPSDFAYYCIHCIKAVKLFIFKCHLVLFWLSIWFLLLLMTHRVPVQK